MEAFCIITNRSKKGHQEATERVQSYLQTHGKRYTVLGDRYDVEGNLCTDISGIPEDTDAVIVLGGDGTVIRAARNLADLELPLFGINLGNLGFLTETELPYMENALHGMLEGKYRIERRMMVDSTVYAEGKVSSETALNDIVITRSGYSRLIGIKVEINDEPVNEYFGDGLIVSTPTGSTGYSISAGGPVVTPGAELMLITPICPHTLNARSLVVAAADKVRVSLLPGRHDTEEAIATIDGITVRMMREGDSIEITGSKKHTNLIRLEGQSFYQVLRNKLGS